MSSDRVLATRRLEVRPPREADRSRFVELFCDVRFMIFSGSLTPDAANRRFDHMVEMCESVPFAKQPVVERASGAIVGYTGVDHFEFEGRERLEWGYRLIPECRGQGYATEASEALLRLAGETFSGDLLALIDPRNSPSQKVARKLGFIFWKQAMVEAVLRNLYTLPIAYTGTQEPVR